MLITLGEGNKAPHKESFVDGVDGGPGTPNHRGEREDTSSSSWWCCRVGPTCQREGSQAFCIELYMRTTLGEGDKALKCLP